ncbi:MAG: hypothetical protein ACFNOK_05425 [Aggregatibacter sp.]
MENIEIVQQRISEQATSRSDVATVKRSIRDLQKQVSRLQNNLSSQLTRQEQVDLTSFQQVWENRKKLNSLNQKINELEQEISPHIPSLGNARLTEEEKRQIKGLHNSGLYTQKELADQYGVTQPTISDIVRQS